MQKQMNKGDVGAVIYVQTLQATGSSQDSVLGLSQILTTFADIFQEPQDLPPARDIDHRIHLQNESEVVNIRPHRMSFKQKDTMEDLILHLLQSQVIRPSVSPFSSPAILVKKKDGT
jgi:hypothetical protein